MAKQPLYRADLMPEDAKKALYDDIEKWFKASERLARVADEENALRIALFDTYFKTSPALEEGTNHIELEFGKRLTAEYRINRKVDEGQLDAAITLGKIDRATVDDIINYKPMLRTGEWKEAMSDIKKLFADIVTETPGTPGLKISTPKR